MSYEVRPFEKCVEIFREAKLGAKLHETSEGNYETETVFSFEDMGEWAANPPMTAIFLQKKTARMVEDAKALVDYSNFGNAVGTWNSNASGTWMSEAGQWIVADCELVQEQVNDDYEGPGDYVNVIFAMWKVEEGIAAAVFSGRRDLLASVIGLDAWPTAGRQSFTGWYGE